MPRENIVHQRHAGHVMPFIGTWISLWLLECMTLGSTQLTNPKVLYIFKIGYEVPFLGLIYETFIKENCWHKVEEHTCTVGPSTKEYTWLLHHLSNPRITSWRSFLRRECFVGEVCKICFIMKSGLWLIILFIGFSIQLTSNLPTTPNMIFSVWYTRYECLH